GALGFDTISKATCPEGQWGQFRRRSAIHDLQIEVRDILDSKSDAILGYRNPKPLQDSLPHHADPIREAPTTLHNLAYPCLIACNGHPLNTADIVHTYAASLNELVNSNGKRWARRSLCDLDPLESHVTVSQAGIWFKCVSN